MSLTGVGSKIVMRETTDVTDWCWRYVGKNKKNKNQPSAKYAEGVV
jgi:hypothetical protein